MDMPQLPQLSPLRETTGEFAHRLNYPDYAESCRRFSEEQQIMVSNVTWRTVRELKYPEGERGAVIGASLTGAEWHNSIDARYAKDSINANALYMILEGVHRAIAEYRKGLSGTWRVWQEGAYGLMLPEAMPKELRQAMPRGMGRQVLVATTYAMNDHIARGI